MRPCLWAVLIGCLAVLGACRHPRASLQMGHPDRPVPPVGKTKPCKLECDEPPYNAGHWPDVACGGPLPNDARYMLLAIIEEAAYYPSNQYAVISAQLACDCLNDDGHIEGMPAPTCGAINDNCCFCLRQAYDAVFATGSYGPRWQVCATKLGHGHGGGTH